MQQPTGIEAYQTHQRMFREALLRAYKTLWKSYQRGIFKNLASYNSVLHSFITNGLTQNFTDYRFEVASLAIALFIDSLGSIPIISEWSCEVAKLDLADESSIDVISAVQSTMAHENYLGALNSLREFVHKLCKGDTSFFNQLIAVAYIIVAVIQHQHEYGYIQRQVERGMTH